MSLTVVAVALATATLALLISRLVTVRNLTVRRAADERHDAALRKLHDQECSVAALRAVEGELRQEVQQLLVRVAELGTQNQALHEQAVAVDAVRKEVDRAIVENQQLQRESFEAMGAKLVEQSKTGLLTAAESKLSEISKPVRDGLAMIDKQLKESEVSRASVDAAIRQAIEGLSTESVRNREQTRALVQALRKPQTRGQWGEMHLKKTVEVAGMIEHTDFNVQVHIPGEDHADRPDMVVHLPGGRHIVIDSKVPLDAFLTAVDCDDETTAATHWTHHGKQLRKHVDGLAAREYHLKVANSPEFVIMFVPSDAILVPALEREPGLLEYAAAKRVLIASPTSLIGLLRTVAFCWKQTVVHENLSRVLELTVELYKRLSTMGGHMEGLGKALDRSVKSYNDMVGSMEGRVLVTARKLRDLKVVDGDIPPLTPNEHHTRILTSSELTGSAFESRALHTLPTPDQPADVESA